MTSYLHSINCDRAHTEQQYSTSLCVAQMAVSVLAVLFLLHILYREGQPQIPIRGPVRVPTKILSASATGACPSNQDTMDAKNEITQNISAILEDLTSCGGPGWRKVGYLDMTDPTQSCPPGLALKTYSPGLRSCGRVTDIAGGCWSTLYSTGGSQYSSVCGRVRGYQFGVTL